MEWYDRQGHPTGPGRGGVKARLDELTAVEKAHVRLRSLAARIEASDARVGEALDAIFGAAGDTNLYRAGAGVLKTDGGSAAMVMRPPRPARLVPLHGEDDLIGYARQEYVAGRIEVEGFEAALDHIFAGGRGCTEFPYLPALSGGQASADKACPHGAPERKLLMTILTEAQDVTDSILDLVARCVENRFSEPGPMPTEDFIDRLCDDYAEGWDIERLDTPAVTKIMMHARSVRRDL